MIKILADQNLYKLEQFLPNEVDLSYYNPTNASPSLNGFDAWLVRTVTKVNKHTFPKLPLSLKFIGTGSSGSDHLDHAYLSDNQITACDAKGCNALAVAEYVLTALLVLQENYEYHFRNKSVGVIGVGAVGSKVAELLTTFGCKVILFDPPRSVREQDFESATIEDIKGCDIITLHVPFTEAGSYKTKHIIDAQFLAGQSFDVVINAARGGVTDEKALTKAHKERKIKYLITDVWENEPHVNHAFVSECDISTPHIAGYSEQAKLQASSIIADKLCTFFDLQKPIHRSSATKEIKLADVSYSLMDLINRCHPILEYDAALRNLANRDDSHELFAKLRTDHPYRFEYPNIKLNGINIDNFPELKLLGVQD